MLIRGMLVGCVLSVVCGFAPSTASAESPKSGLKILDPKPDQVVVVQPGKWTVIKASGTHNLPKGEFVYIFLSCKFGHYYLQQPEVLLAEGTWQHNNVSVGADIRIVHVISVQQAGQNKIMAWLQDKPRALSAAEIRGLGGETLATVNLDVK
jgi:hypothetical protein